MNYAKGILSVQPQFKLYESHYINARGHWTNNPEYFLTFCAYDILLVFKLYNITLHWYNIKLGYMINN